MLNHFSLVRYIGIGIGLGANVLVRHALQVGVQIVKYLVAAQVVAPYVNRLNDKTERVQKTLLDYPIISKNSRLQYPERVDSLMVANACSGKAGWVEWGYQVLVDFIYSRTLCLYSEVDRYNWISIL